MQYIIFEKNLITNTTIVLEIRRLENTSMRFRIDSLKSQFRLFFSLNGVQPPNLFYAVSKVPIVCNICNKICLRRCFFFFVAHLLSGD